MINMPEVLVLAKDINISKKRAVTRLKSALSCI